MSLRIRLAPFARTGAHLVDLALRELHDAVAAVIADVRREVVIRGVELEDGVEKVVAHGLGYAYSHVSVSPVRGASTSGRVEEVEATAAQRKDRLTLVANGFGATVTVDLRVT
jgi:hypothetical protein